MYIWLFSRSEGAGSATRRNTRGLTRSVIALIVPPLPAASRPSKITMTRSPFSLTHSWSTHSFACSRSSSFSNFFCFIFAIGCVLSSRLPSAAEGTIEFGARPQLRAVRLGEQQLLLKQLLIRREDLDVVGKARVVAGPGEIRCVAQRDDTHLPLGPHVSQLLDRHEGVGDFTVAIQG